MQKKISILLISIFLMSHLAIAPAIPKLYELYNDNKNIGLAKIENLITIPALMITIFVVLSNFIVSILGKKKTILIGLVFISLSGFISFFTNNFNIIFICRLLLGVGIGLYNSLSISIISDYYKDEERATMIGLRTSFLNIGKALTTFVAGYALLLGANYVFLVYLLAIPIAIMFFINVEENNKDKKQNIKSVIKFDENSILLMLITFFVGISYIGATIKIPTLLITKYNISTTFSSNLLTILAISGILSGFIFGKLIKILNFKTLYIMILIMFIGNILFILTTKIIFLYIGAIFIGMSFVGTMSCIFYFISKKYKKENINFVTSMALTTGNIGVILTPIILTKLPEKLNWELFLTPFYIISFFMIINFIISIFLLEKNK